ncbi:MAG: hypothetical protein AABM30_07555 [Actinomycetota bacterium]
MFGAASLLGIGLYARRGRAHDRIDLYFGDGSVISLDGASAEAARLVPLVHDALRTARS